MPREQSIADICGGALAKTPMTDHDYRAIYALKSVRLMPASWAKRFIHDMYDYKGEEITPRQRMWIWKLVWMYRKQLNGKGKLCQELVRMAGRYAREAAGQEPIEEQIQKEFFHAK